MSKPLFLETSIDMEAYIFEYGYDPDTGEDEHSLGTFELSWSGYASPPEQYLAKRFAWMLMQSETENTLILAIREVLRR